MTDWGLLRQLATPFPKGLVRKPPKGKYGEYVKHSDVTQRLLSIVGLHDFKVVEVIRGPVEELVTLKHTYPARPDAIVACIGELTITDSDGRRFTVSEVGTEDTPVMHHDGDNLKNCASDAYKRCAMRFGVGLHLWSDDSYFLDAQIVKDRFPYSGNEAPQSTTAGNGGVVVSVDDGREETVTGPNMGVRE